MSKSIVVCGFGAGISEAVARKFGLEGFKVALVARSADKLEAAAAKLKADGIEARAFPADLGDLAAIAPLFAAIEKAHGPTTVLHWNAYSGAAGDALTASAEELEAGMRVSVSSLWAATQAVVPSMEGKEGAAVLVTGGGFQTYDPNVDRMIVQFNCMGLGIAKAAQHKLVGLLHEKLAAKGIYVGEVTVMGMVKGTAFDFGNATLEGATVADAFWGIYTERTVVSVPCG